MIRYGRHVLKEIWLGIQDNLRAIWQILRHPLLSLRTLANALLHPIITVQNILNFAWRSPWRFLTNVGLSLLEGRLLGMGWQHFNQGAQSEAISALEAASNTTQILPEVVLPETTLWQGFTNLFSASKLPTTGYCSATHCSLPTTTAMSAPSVPATAVSASAAVLENDKKAVKSKPH